MTTPIEKYPCLLGKGYCRKECPGNFYARKREPAQQAVVESLEQHPEVSPQDGYRIFNGVQKAIGEILCEK